MTNDTADSYDDRDFRPIRSELTPRLMRVPQARFLRLIVAALLASSLSLQAAGQELDFGTLHANAVRAMGGNEIDRIELSGSGWDACLGQAWNVNEGWARWEVQDFRRIIDYEAVTSVQSARRRPGMDPDRLGGCGAQPDGTWMRQQTSVAGPGAPWAEQLDIWLTPPGFLHLAAANDAAVMRDGNSSMVVVSVPDGDITHTLNGYFDERFRLKRIETWIDNPIFGDMLVEAEFENYEEHAGLMFPARIIQKRGGYTTLSLNISNVIANTDARARPTSDARPEDGRQSDQEDEASPVVRIGEGIYVVRGSYRAVVVEFEDYSVVIDGMQNDARTRQVIESTKATIPDKPIRYVVNTHSHFDHASGLRQFVAEGATILTYETNVDFLRQALNTPRTLNPAATDISDVPLNIEGVGDRYVLTDDAGQRLELHHLRGSRHAADMLVAFLPRTGTVVEADVLQPWISPMFGGSSHPFVRFLERELTRLQLDYENFVPVHALNEGPLMPRSALSGASP